MAIFVSTDAYFVINGVDLSDHVTDLALDLQVDQQDTTAMGTNGWRSHIPGLKTGSVKVGLNGDYAAAAVDATLWGAFATIVTFDVRPVKTGGRSATNPSYTGSLLVTAYQPITGTVGQLNKTSITLPTTGVVSRQTS